MSYGHDRLLSPHPAHYGQLLARVQANEEFKYFV